MGEMPGGLTPNANLSLLPFPFFQYSNIPLFLLYWRHSQVAKAAVCKTVIHRFESGCRLQSKSGVRLEAGSLFIFIIVPGELFYFQGRLFQRLDHLDEIFFQV